MKLVNWNVNNLSHRIEQGFLRHFDSFDADFFCIHGTELSQDQLALELPGYNQFWLWPSESNPGAAVFTKHDPIHSVVRADRIRLEFLEFILIIGAPEPDTDKPVIFCSADGVAIPNGLDALVYRRGTHTAIEPPCPISLDLDLPCNGSILSPSSIGSARILPMAEKEPAVKESDTPPAAKGLPKWIPAACIVLILLLCITLLWPKAPAEEPSVTVPDDLVPIQVTQLSVIPICPDYLYISVTLPDDVQGSSMLLVGDLINDSAASDGSLRVYTDPFLVSDLDQATFCIQVELTDEALALDNDGWEFSAGTSFGATSSMPDVIIENYNVIPYYTSDTRLHIAGWIIFGNVHEKFPLVMTVSRSDSDYTYQDHSVYGTHYHIDPPEVPFRAEYLTAPPVLIEESKIDPDTQIEYDLLSFNSVYTYYVTQRDTISSSTPYTTSIQDASYWIFIKVDSTLREKVGFRYLDFTVSKPDQSTGQSFFQYREPFASAVYSDADLTNLTGWLIYDANPQVNDLVFTLCYWSKGEEIVYTLPFHFATYVTEEQAADMYTHGLIRAIFNNPTLCDEILRSLYPRLPNTPVCKELETRTDAVAQVMNCDISTLDADYRMVPHMILLCLRDQMTPAEEAKFLLNDFPSCPYPFDYSNMIEVETDTEGIVSLLSEDKRLWTYLSFGDDVEVQRQIYLLLRQRNSLLLMLEQCDDAAEVMMEHIKVCESETCRMNLLYNMWEWIQTQT